MKRVYAPFYFVEYERWLVIYKDEPSKTWYVHIPDAGDEETATQTADILNRST